LGFKNALNFKLFVGFSNSIQIYLQLHSQSPYSRQLFAHLQAS
jgi:hypothetical protein